MKRRHLLPLLLLPVVWFGCVKSGPETSNIVPASMRAFTMPYGKVWKVVLDTVQYEFLIPVEVAEAKKGYFSSELIKDYQAGQRSKYRLSGTVMFDGNATVVKLYRQLELEQNGEWVTIPSDLSLESRILSAVGDKLRAK